MKKRILSIALTLATLFSLTGCGGNSTPAAAASAEAAAPSITPASSDNTESAPAQEEEAPETSVIKWNCGTSGNVLLTIAEKWVILRTRG